MASVAASRLRGEEQAHLGGLWRHPDFVKLLAGDTVSLVGSQVTAVALPLTAAVTLDAGASQMGLLGAAGTAPFLLAPVVGV